MATHAVLKGLDGWFRWFNCAAHFFVDGEQSCRTFHCNFEGQSKTPTRPNAVDLSPFGTPFGRVCSRCLKFFRAKKGTEQ